MARVLAFLLGIILGAAVGAAIAALLAPESGVELRADIGERIQRGKAAKAEAQQATAEALRQKFRAQVNNQEAPRRGTAGEGIITVEPKPSA